MAGKASTDPNVFILPDLGEGVHEAELISWKVSPGEEVEEHQVVAEMETDKALVEVPSPRAGTIKELFGEVGQILKVGEPAWTYEGAGDAGGEAGSGGGAAASNGQAAKAEAESSEEEREDAGTVVGTMSGGVGGVTRQGGKALATPAVRRLAKQLGVDIDGVKGTGLAGRVTDRDVRAAASSDSRRPVEAKGEPSLDGGSRGDRAVRSDSSARGGERGGGGYQQQPAAAGGYGGGYQPQPMGGAQYQHGGMPMGMGGGYGQPMMPMGMGMGMGMPMGMGMGMPMGYPMPMMMGGMPGMGMMPGMMGGGGMAGQGGLMPAPGYTPAGGDRPVPSPAQKSELGGAETAEVPFISLRRKIAEHLRKSVDTAVHFTVMDDADVTQLDAVRREMARQSGEKLSFLPFVAAAVSRVLSGEFGALNAHMDDANGKIVQHRAVHLGVAVDTDSGLMVPVIRDADRLPVIAVQREIGRVAEAARNRSAGRDELSGSTFTISNVGSHAGKYATPVINYPEVGILAVGRVYDAAVVRGGQAMVGKLMPLSLACDHRVVDGATGALALAAIVKLLERPEELL